METGWEVEKPAKCVTECGHMKEQDEHQIIFSKDVWHVVQAMLRKFPTHEWQMMLTGAVDKDVCYVTGYYVTKQDAYIGTVDNKDCVDKAMIEEKHIVAGIHSHVNMGTTPSSRDINDSVMSLIDYHIIVNNRLETNGMRKCSLPCGKAHIGKAQVLVEQDVDLDTLPIEGVENVNVKTYTHTPVTYEGQGKWHGGWKKFEHERKHQAQKDYDREYDAEVMRHMQECGGYGY